MSCPFTEDDDPLLPVVDCPTVAEVCPVDIAIDVDVIVCCLVGFVSVGGWVSSISFCCGPFCLFSARGWRNENDRSPNPGIPTKYPVKCPD
jgi:hypothetical protein